jgi:phosphate transport system permease protein
MVEAGNGPRRWWPDRRLGIVANPPLARQRARGINPRGDLLFRRLLAIFAAVIVTILALMLVMVVSQSAEAWRTFGLGFITNTEWAPPFNKFGALPYIYGTVLTSVIALILAAPIGVGCAIFITQFAPRWLRSPVSFMVELLAAVPSVVFGLWGIFVFAPWMRTGPDRFLVDHFGFIPLFKGPTFGLGVLSAGIILAIIIVPYITSVTREVMLLTPTSQREGMLALGATRWEVIRYVILPFARSGIVGGSILALGRALGETMAVTMIIGNRAQIKPSLFAQGATMSSVIANEFAEAASTLYTSSLIAIALLLLVVALIMNILGRLLVWSVARSR